MDILSRKNTPEAIAAATALIRQAVLRESRQITQPDFERIASDDLARLFGLYDRHFFDHWLSQTLKARGMPLRFRLSSTMTRTGGKTSRYRHRPGGVVGCRFEIAIACRVLFMTFRDVPRPVEVCGLTCKDRLEALQRILEHEIIHLTEMLTWGRSSCSDARFKKLAADIFGHVDTRHALVTAREHAAVRHGVVLGGMVQFQFDGQRLVGRVNRIHHRATVLVERSDGMRYSDGKMYAKYYVPLDLLKPR